MSGASDGIGTKPSARISRRAAIIANSVTGGSAIPPYNENRRAAGLGGPQSRRVWTDLNAARIRQQAQITADALGVAGMAAAVLGNDGEVLGSNAPLKALIPDIVKDIAGRPRFVDEVADNAVADAIKFLRSATPPNGLRVLPIHAGKGRALALAYLVPFHSEALSSAEISAVLVIVPLRLPRAPGVHILQQLFGLSPAEARVANGIAARKTIATLASDFGISRETVRTQLKIVLTKTGTKRQLELAVLLTQLPLLK